jgi:hypothetical protein
VVDLRPGLVALRADLRDGGNTLSLGLGKGLKAKLHKAKVKPTLTIALSDGSTLRTRVAI